MHSNGLSTYIQSEAQTSALAEAKRSREAKGFQTCFKRTLRVNFVQNPKFARNYNLRGPKLALNFA